MSENDGQEFVRITNREIWTLINSTDDKVQHIQSIMDTVLNAGVEREKRIRKLELKVNSLLSGVVSSFIILTVAIARGFGH